MYTDHTPLSLGSYKSNDAFDIYARTEYPFESKDVQQEIALIMRMENTPQEKFPIASLSLVCLVIIMTSIAVL